MKSILMLKLMRFKQDIVVMLLMTFLSIMFIFIIGGANDGAYKYDIMIATDEASPSYIRLMEELNKSKSYNFIETDYDIARAEVEEGKILAALYYSDDNISVLKTKEDVNIFILENVVTGTKFNIDSVSNISKEITEYLNNLTPIDKEEVESFIYSDIMDSINNRKAVIVSKSFINSSNQYEYDSIKHTTIGMILFMSMFTIVFGIGSILEDKQYNTWNKMLISPLSKKGILGGNLVATFIVGSAQILLLMVLTKYMMGMDWGSSDKFIWTVLIGFLFVLTTTSLGLMLSSVVKTHGQLSTISPILLTSTSMLGGAMWPLEIVQSKILLFLASLTPQKWAIEGMERIVMYGGGLSDILPNIAVLCLMTTIFFIIGVKKLN